MSYQLTSETKPDGRPIWECQDCRTRVAGHVVAEHRCVEGPPVLQLEELPCAHRGEPSGTVGCGCGGGKRPLTVYACDLHGRCLLQASNVAGLRVKNAAGKCVKPQICLGCADGPRPMTASPT